MCRFLIFDEIGNKNIFQSKRRNERRPSNRMCAHCTQWSSHEHTIQLVENKRNKLRRRAQTNNSCINNELNDNSIAAHSHTHTQLKHQQQQNDTNKVKQFKMCTIFAYEKRSGLFQYVLCVCVCFGSSI